MNKNNKERYTALFEFEGSGPTITKSDSRKGGKLCAVSFSDEFFTLQKLKELAEAIADGKADPQQMAIQTLDLIANRYLVTSVK